MTCAECFRTTGHNSGCPNSPAPCGDCECAEVEGVEGEECDCRCHSAPERDPDSEHGGHDQ